MSVCCCCGLPFLTRWHRRLSLLGDPGIYELTGQLPPRVPNLNLVFLLYVVAEVKFLTTDPAASYTIVTTGLMLHRSCQHCSSMPVASQSCRARITTKSFATRTIAAFTVRSSLHALCAHLFCRFAERDIDRFPIAYKALSLTLVRFSALFAGS